MTGELCFFFSSRRRHTRYWRDWSSDVCSSDLGHAPGRVRGGKPDWQAGRVCRPFHRSGDRGQDRGELGGGGHARRDAAARSGSGAGTIHFAVIDHMPWASSRGTMHGVLWSATGKQTGKEETKMSAEENKAVVRREQEELWNHTGDLNAAEELYAVGQAEAAKQEAAHFRQGFPDVIRSEEHTSEL